jgi:hypothetical protein
VPFQSKFQQKRPKFIVDLSLTIPFQPTIWKEPAESADKGWLDNCFNTHERQVHSSHHASNLITFLARALIWGICKLTTKLGTQNDMLAWSSVKTAGGFSKIKAVARVDKFCFWICLCSGIHIVTWQF